MARPTLTEEEKKAKQEQKELEKKQKQEQKEKEIANCILKESYGFSKTEINKFIDFCKDYNATEWEVVRLAVSALLSGQIEFEVETKTTFKLK